MSFLAPLFLVGAAGIALPIILHLIRRQAKGQQDFSSLIFLDPSPPTLMQRNRIDQWLLLLLRALAILLLATAFARPYWNQQTTPDAPRQEFRRAILMDISASMQREGLWTAAVDAVQSILKTVEPLDSIALYAFDDRVQTLVSQEDSLQAQPSNRVQQVLAALGSLQPSSRGTNLGLALATVGDRLVRTEESDEDGRVSASEIILVSDFQAGSLLDRLENYQWPVECKLTLKRVEPKQSENVSASILASKEESLSLAPNGTRSSTAASDRKPVQDGLAIRLSNHDSRSSAKVSLRWLDQANTEIPDTYVESEVPASGSTVLRIPKLATEAGRLRLEGDAAGFDNERFVAKPPKRHFSIVCLDREQRAPTESLGYFLQQLPMDDDLREVQFVWRAPGAAEPWPETSETPLMVASHDLLAADAIGFRTFLEKGGHGLWVLDQSLEDPIQLAKIQALWAALTGDLPPAIREAKVGRDAMFQEIDFTHPIFRALADSRFNDFTKIRFWRHRCVALDEAAAWNTLARYDDDFPAIAYRPVGDGLLWLMTAGWQPVESQLALSSKFVPIVSGMFALAAPSERPLESLVSGDKIECLDGELWSDESGKALQAELGADDRPSIVFEQPGFYRVQRDGQSRSVAVNLPLAESDTQAMEIERLERLGVVTSDEKPTAIENEKKEQLRGIELEGQQRIWRWLMVAMLAAIVFETIWATRP